MANVRKREQQAQLLSATVKAATVTIGTDTDYRNYRNTNTQLLDNTASLSSMDRNQFSVNRSPTYTDRKCGRDQLPALTVKSEDQRSYFLNVPENYPDYNSDSEYDGSFMGDNLGSCGDLGSSDPVKATDQHSINMERGRSMGECSVTEPYGPMLLNDKNRPLGAEAGHESDNVAKEKSYREIATYCTDKHGNVFNYSDNISKHDDTVINVAHRDNMENQEAVSSYKTLLKNKQFRGKTLPPGTYIVSTV